MKGGFNATVKDPKYRSQTTYYFHKCSAEQEKTLKQAVEDGSWLANEGLKYIARPGGPTLPWSDFESKSAIDYFGPTSENANYQARIKSPFLCPLIETILTP